MDLSRDPVGRWELARLLTVEANVFQLSERLIHSYAADVTQVIRVPEFTQVYIRPGARIVAQPWDGATGGIVALLATGTVTNKGSIDVSGMGFRGGRYVQQAASRECNAPSVEANRGARRGEGVDSTDFGRGSGRSNVANGGGGGSCLPSGGGGGGNAGPGVQGGQPLDGPRDIGGLGGVGLIYSLLDHLTLGGGGGGGSGRMPSASVAANGGQGGGAIFLRAGALIGGGALEARGEPGGSGEAVGAGGGGAGGSILVRVAGTMECSVADASGGQGGRGTGAEVLAPGGGGGGGRVAYQASGVSDCPVKVEAGLAGGSEEDQPVPSPLPSHMGSVVRLPGELMALWPATILQPEPGARIRTRQPVITGSAPTGLEVVVYIDGGEVGRTVAEGGFFALPLNQPLAVGPHQVQASTASGGLLSERSAPQWFTVSTEDVSPRDSTDMVSGAADKSFSLKIGEVEYIGKSIFVASEYAPQFSGFCACNITGSVEFKIDNPANLFSATVECKENFTWNVPPPAVRWLPEGQEVAQLYFSAKLTCKAGTQEIKGDFFIDQSPPDTQITSFPPNSSVGPGVGLAIAFGATDLPVENTEFEYGCSVNGSDWSYTGNCSPCSKTVKGGYACSTTTPGVYTLLVSAKDQAGNVDPTPAAYVWEVDNKPPSIPTISEPVSGYVRSKTPTIRGTAGSSGDRVEVAIGDMSFPNARVVANEQKQWQLSAPDGSLTEGGSYTVQAKAIDVAGNESALSTSVTITVDSVPPQTQIVSSRPSKPSPSRSITIQVSATDTPGSGVARFECGFNGSFSNCLDGAGGDLTTSAPGDGLYALQVRAVDRAGHVDPTPELWIWEVDTKEPDTFITNKPPEATYEEQAIFEFSAQDSDIHIEYECEYVPPAGTPVVGKCGNPYILKGLLQGHHILRVIAIDRAGNRDPSAAKWEWFVDKGVPQASIISPTEDFLVTNQTSTRITFGQATDAGVVSYECRVGTTTQFEPCESPKNVERGDGEHIFQVRAVNDGGIRTPENLYDSFRWVVDTIDPETIIVNGPDDGAWFNSGTVSFTVAAVDSNLEGFQCSLNNEDFRECPARANGGSSIAFPYTNLDDGNYTLQVRAVDKASNFDATPVQRSWAVDTQAPAPPEFSATNDEMRVFSSRPVIGGSAEPASRVFILLGDQSEPAATAVTGSDGTWRAQIDQSLASADYDIKGYAVDRAGNRSTDVQVKLIVDNQTPARVVGGGLGCTSFPGEVSILALAGGLGLLGRRRRGREQGAQHSSRD